MTQIPKQFNVQFHTTPFSPFFLILKSNCTITNYKLDRFCDVTGDNTTQGDKAESADINSKQFQYNLNSVFDIKQTQFPLLFCAMGEEKKKVGEKNESVNLYSKNF